VAPSIPEKAALVLVAAAVTSPLRREFENGTSESSMAVFIWPGRAWPSLVDRMAE
jgi:hypothetical protein